LHVGDDGRVYGHVWSGGCHTASQAGQCLRAPRSSPGLPWIGGYLEEVPADKSKREGWLTKNRAVRITPEVRASLEKWYGKEYAAGVAHAEAFEVCEYGTQPTETHIRSMFPMLTKK
jgi:hypothetical protein